MTDLSSRLGAVLGLAVVGASCGLVSSDVADFTLDLPDKNFSIDASSWQVDDMEARALLGMSCASAPTVCNSAAQAACEMNCSGTCSMQTQKCELELDVALYQPINLLIEQPELKSINDQPVIKVTIDSVTYDVPTNTLNVATPELGVYVAPITIMDPTDPNAVKIGTIPPLEPGVTVEKQAIAFTPDGKAKLIAMMSTFKTPFNVIVGSTLVVGEGQPFPTGKLDSVIHIRGHAGL